MLAGLIPFIKKEEFLKRIGSSGILVGLLLIGCLFIPNLESVNQISDRMLGLLIDPEEDVSYLERRAQFETGIAAIQSNFWFGQYMEDWWRTGVRGLYIHNWLSFLVCYGVFMFLVSIALIVGAFYNIFVQIRAGSSIARIMVLPVLIYCILAVVFARHYGWHFVWLGLGLATTIKR